MGLSEPIARPSRRRRLALAWPPVLCAGLAYLNALNNPFVWDDFHTVADNRSLETLWNLRAIVLQDVSRPLVNLSFAIDRALWGAAPFGFHLTSVLLHMVNVALFFLLADGLGRDAFSSSSTPTSADRPNEQSPSRLRSDLIAAIAAWLFAVHPMMTEAVGYISGRADVLAATFLLLAFLAIRRWAHGAGPHWLFAGLAAWIGGIVSKETALVFPLLLAAYRAGMSRSLPATVLQRLTRIALVLIGAMAVLGGVRMALLLAVENPTNTRIHWDLLLVDLDVVRRYFVLLVAPGGQSVFHPVISISSLWQWRAVGAVVFIAGLLGVAWTCRRHASLAAIGISWFLLALVPAAVLVLFDLAHPMAEHRTYFANAGLFIAVGYGVAWMLARRRPDSSRQRLVAVMLFVAPVTLIGQTVVRNAMWTDPRLLWLQAAERAPDIWLPHLLLGEALRARGMREEAVVAFRNAVRLRPDHADAYLKLAVCLAELNRLDQAEAVFSDLTRAVPASPIGPEGLGSIAMLTGRRDAARSHFQDALRLDPGNIAARQSLALLSEQEAHPAEARRFCEEIRQIAPDTPGVAECIARNSGS